MIIERTMSDSWLSNSYLVADSAGGHGVIIDTGGPAEPLLAAIDTHRLQLTHVLCTHHHHDHVANNDAYTSRHHIPICGHPLERELFGSLDLELSDGDELAVGTLRIRALHIPGHTCGQLAFLVNDAAIFTGDTLFRRSIGGTRGPGHTTFEDIRHSIMEILMALPHETAVYPGHTDATSIGEEWEHNPFVRAWRGADPPGETRCTAFGEPATLLLSARDYDGGTKCWVRFDDGRLDIAPGSQVKTQGS